MRKPTRSQLLGFLLAGACLIYGGLIAVEQIRMQGWPSTRAVILEYTPEIYEDAQPLLKRPSVRFEYYVDQQTLESTRLNPAPLLLYNPRLKPGSEATCWYDSSSPSTAYLVNDGVTHLSFVVLFIGSIIWVAAIHCYQRNIHFFTLRAEDEKNG